MSSGQQRSWLHILGFTVLTVIIVYVMLDVEYPRAGLIRLESADQLLVKSPRAYEVTADDRTEPALDCNFCQLLRLRSMI
jgi:hypothetical protein